jgi:hypothetical protein
VKGTAMMLAEAGRVAAQVMLDCRAHARLVRALGLGRLRLRPQGGQQNERRQTCADYLFHLPLPFAPNPQIENR